MTTARDVPRQLQKAVRDRYHGKYAALVRKLGPGWHKMKLSRILNAKDPAMGQLLAVCSAAGVAVTPYLQQLHL